MYDQLFTDVWKMDRCMEASWFGMGLSHYYVLFALLSALLFYVVSISPWGTSRIPFLVKKWMGRPSRFAMNGLILLLSMVGALVMLVPVSIAIVALAIMFGFLVFNCNFGPLWSRITPAHEVHAVLKNVRAAGGETPRSLEELKQLHPSAFEKLEGRAKLQYEYVPDRDGYHFVVQPSRYVIADFTDTNDFMLYRTDSVISRAHFTDNPMMSEK